MKNYLDFLEGKARFASWLIVFFVLLITVPVLLVSDMKLIAKVFGAILIAGLSVALWYWRTQTIRRIRRRSRVPLNLNDRFWLNQHIPFYRSLSSSDKKIFEDRMALFLAEIIITEVGKEKPEKSTCFYVASSAVIAFWGLPYWNYGELSEVLIYPDDFTMNNQFGEGASVQGKVHHGGMMDSTMILSLPALVRGFQLQDAKNVGIHEFSHLLDKSDEVLDGTPVFLAPEDRKLWSDLVDRELERRKKASKFDPYGFTSEEEFFAVLMETFRENPGRVEKRFPELYRILMKHFER